MLAELGIKSQIIILINDKHYYLYYGLILNI